MMCDFLGTALVQTGPLEAHHLGPLALVTGDCLIILQN